MTDETVSPLQESDDDFTFEDEDSSLFDESGDIGDISSEGGGVGFLLRRKEGFSAQSTPNDTQPAPYSGSYQDESSPALTSAYSSSPGYVYDRRGYNNNEYFDDDSQSMLSDLNVSFTSESTFQEPELGITDFSKIASKKMGSNENIEAEIKLEKFLNAHKVDPGDMNMLHLPGNRVHKEAQGMEEEAVDSHHTAQQYPPSAERAFDHTMHRTSYQSNTYHFEEQGVRGQQSPQNSSPSRQPASRRSLNNLHPSRYQQRGDHGEETNSHGKRNDYRGENDEQFESGREMSLQEQRLKFAAGDYSTSKRIGYEDELDELRRIVKGLRSELDRRMFSDNSSGRGAGIHGSKKPSVAHTTSSMSYHPSEKMLSEVCGVQRVDGVQVMIDLGPPTERSMKKQWLVPPVEIIGPLHPSKHTADTKAWPIRKTNLMELNGNDDSVSEKVISDDEDDNEEEDEDDDDFDFGAFSEANDIKSKLESLSKFEEKLSKELDEQRMKMEQQRSRHVKELKEIDQQCEPLRMDASRRGEELRIQQEEKERNFNLPPSTLDEKDILLSKNSGYDISTGEVFNSNDIQNFSPTRKQGQLNKSSSGGDWGDDVEAELASARHLFAELQNALQVNGSPSRRHGASPIRGGRVHPLSPNIRGKKTPSTSRRLPTSFAPYGGMGFVHVSVESSGPVLNKAGGSGFRKQTGGGKGRGNALSNTFRTQQQRYQRTTRTLLPNQNQSLRKKDWV